MSNEPVQFSLDPESPESVATVLSHLVQELAEEVAPNILLGSVIHTLIPLLCMVNEDTRKELMDEILKTANEFDAHFQAHQEAEAKTRGKFVHPAVSIDG